MPTPPTLAEVKDYLGEVSFEDAVITSALDAEIAAQDARVRFPADPDAPADPLLYPADLAEALKRRVARNLALRGLPLAVLQGDAEAGNTVLPGQDPEVRRLEAPHRRLVVG